MTPAPDALALSRRETIFRWVVMGTLAAVTVAWMLRGVFSLPEVPDNYTNGFSHSPGGHSALAELLEKNGRDIRVRADALKLPEFETGSGETLALLEPRPEHLQEFEDDFRRVFADAQSRPCSLVFAFPKRYYGFSRHEDGKEVIVEDEYTRMGIEAILEATGLDDTLDIGRTAGDTEIRAPEGEGPTATFKVSAPVQTFLWKVSPSSLRHSRMPKVLLETADGRPVALRLFPKHQFDEGGLVLIADPDLLGNRYIGQPGAGTLALHLFADTPRNGIITFDETLHGFSTEADIEYLAMTPPGLWLTLSLFGLLLLFGWREATVIRPVAAESHDRQARLYAVDGIARMMLRARDHGAAYRALMRRSTLVLGHDPTAVKAEGSRGGDTSVIRSNTGRIRHAPGADDEEKLLNAAAMIAEKLRRDTAPGHTNDKQGQA